jgi:hypothetical protein
MEKALLREKVIAEIMNLPDDKIQMLVDFIGYLNFMQNKQTVQPSETEWKKAIEELIALSGIGESNSGDLADNHEGEIYG